MPSDVSQTERPEWDPALRDRVRRLMRVLRSIAAAKTRPMRHTDSAHGVLWLHRAAEHMTVHEVTEPGHEVLRAPRVPSEPMPPVPADLVRWVEVSERRLTEPELRDHGPDRHGGIVDVGDEERRSFDRWYREWATWAAAERGRRARTQVHDELFRMHRIAEDRPESVEIVLAAGLLHLPDPDTGGVHVHVVNQPVDLVREVTTGDMVVSLTEAPPRLEDDELLTGDDWFDGSGGPQLRERLDATVSSAIDPNVGSFIKEWRTRALRIHCEVSDAWADPGGRSSVVQRAPAVVARPRSGFALRNYYDTMITALEDRATPVPLGLAQLVEPLESDVRMGWLDRSGKAPGVDLAADPLFPLPANPAQRQIIDRMGADTGVVVEGPPGTGKTHTIANLVSSLLAEGQRVLVTSEKAQALKVLRDKLPREMQDLCISMTDASSRGDSDLARSITKISTAKTSFEPRRAARRIGEFTERRASMTRDRQRLLTEIQALRDAETVIHPQIAPGFEGTTATIARALVATADDGWIRDPVPETAPLDADEVTELLGLLRSETDQRRSRRRQELPALDTLPAAATLTHLAAALQQGDQAVHGSDGDLVMAIENLPDGELGQLDPAARRIGDALAELDRGPGDRRWGRHMAEEQLRGGRSHAWRNAAHQLDVVDHAREGDLAAQNADIRVDVTTAPVPSADALEAYADDHEQNGSSFWPWMKSAEQKTIESYGERVLVNGRKIEDAVAARMAAGHLRVFEAAALLNRVFGPLGYLIHESPYRPDLVDQMATLADIVEAVGRVIACQQETARLLGPLPAAQRPRIDSLEGLHRVAGVALAVGQARQARVARAEITTTANGIDVDSRGERAPEHTVVLAAWRDADADVDRYRLAVEALGRAHAEQRDQFRSDDLLERLRHDAPELADELETDPDAGHWDARLARLPEAWARARAATWMARHQEPGREQTLERALAVVTHDRGDVTAALAAERAWKACLEGMSTQEMQALQMYRERAAQVGKGTGKFAEKFRLAARQAMAEAQHAVPAWIMPIQQVLASVSPEKDVFDVVIVDEASQAELTSAFLLWLAPRMIVVGDDKQCTPAEVTQGALAPIFDRLDNELPDLPAHRRLQFTSKSSVFSLMRSCFPQVIRLQEHFRCMPEIIEWSSREFYADAPLVPLRQFGADRLPPLRATYVPDAVQAGGRERIANHREAEVIADLVEQCVEDSAYDGKTFGVVVLQGHGQVGLIEDVLRGRIGDEQWEKRRLRVGSPPDFQGDERNVVWLSMVLAPDYTSIALTSEMYRQRFNVAASRAQDQLWLVHSKELGQLGAKDMRRSLLEYMTAADDQVLGAMPDDVRRDERTPGFDSLLEQQVFCDLAEWSHHVTPQLEINGRRLDLVVTGPGGRVAVECDADTYPMGEEERRAEVEREQELKRAGWRFTRVRESSYVLDPDGVRQQLDHDLRRAGITPLLVDGVVPAAVRVIDRAEVPETSTDDEAEAAAPTDAVAPTPVDEPPVDESVPAEQERPRTGQEPPSLTPTPPAEPRREPDDAAILALFGPGEALTRADLARSLGISVGNARHHLARLRQAGWLVEHGDRQDPLYVQPRRRARGDRPVADRPAEARRAMTDGLLTAEVHELVLRLVGEHGTLAATELADLLGVPKMEGRGLLTDLSVAGRLTKTGEPVNPRFSIPGPAPLDTPVPPGTTELDAGRRAQIRRIADEMRILGAADPAWNAEVPDDPDRGGGILCIAELFWADGIRGDGGKPVVLELDPEEADLDRLRELRCRVFTSIPDLRSTMTAELAGSHRPGG